LSSAFENLSRPKPPKRIGFLFEKAFSKESLYQAFIQARKGKRKKVECFEFESRLGSEIDDLYESLHNGTYQPQPLRTFEVFEPKRRVIHAPYFRDLVVQHAVYKVIYPIFNRGFIDQNYACRKGGGTHKASDYAQRAMRKYSGDLYYAKLDIKKFFYSIGHAVLRELIERKIKDKRFISVMLSFLGSDKVGIPIGNLLSQVYALLVLNPLDHFAKRVLKIKHYVRYMDDFVAIGLTLEQAKRFKTACEQFVNERLKLRLSHWTINKLKRGLNFVGYRTWRSIKFVRKHSVTKFKRLCKRLKIESITSLLGHAAHSASIVFFTHYLQSHGLLQLLHKRTLTLCLAILRTHQPKRNLQPCALATPARMN